MPWGTLVRAPFLWWVIGVPCWSYASVLPQWRHEPLMGWWFSCNVPGNTLSRVPLGFPHPPLFLSVCAETSFLPHNLTKPTVLGVMKQLYTCLHLKLQPRSGMLSTAHMLSEESSSLLAPRLGKENHLFVFPNALQELFPVWCAMPSAEKNNLPSANHPWSWSGRLSHHHHELLVIRDHYGGQLSYWRLNPQEDLDLEKFLLLCAKFQHRRLRQAAEKCMYTVLRGSKTWARSSQTERTEVISLSLPHFHRIRHKELIRISMLPMVCRQHWVWPLHLLPPPAG